MPFVALLRCVCTLAVLDGLCTLSVRRCVCGLAACDNTSKAVLLKRFSDGLTFKVSCPVEDVCCYVLVEQVTGQKSCGTCVRLCQYWPVLRQSLCCPLVR
jgi:hypothetical protein